MKIFRVFLPLYKKAIKSLSHGKGYGKKRTIRKIMHFFNLLFRSNEIKVHGHTMYLTRKGFLEYSTEGIYGKLDTLTVERLIKPGDYVIDVGAAIGYFTLIFARLVGKKGLVISFEPKKDRFEILTKNVKVNNYENVMLENKAILNEGNKSTFYSRDDGIAGLRFLATPEKPFYYLDTHKHTVPTQVSTVSLDEYLKDLKIIDRISFMKIDVDGPELLVLESAQSLLKNKDLKILIEWDQESAKWSCCDPAAMIDLLAENDFKIFYPDYKSNKFFEISKTELLKIKADETINILCTKDPLTLRDNGLLK